jgi:hypothetical protein
MSVSKNRNLSSCYRFQRPNAVLELAWRLGYSANKKRISKRASRTRRLEHGGEQHAANHPRCDYFERDGYHRRCDGSNGIGYRD